MGQIRAEESLSIGTVLNARSNPVLAGPTLPIAARQVTKRYGETLAVDDVDLIVAAGQIHGLLGPNGAGKTTVLAMLFGLVEPDSGSLSLFGRDRESVDVEWLDGVAGFIETPRFYPYLSARKNLEHLARLDGGQAPRLIGGALDQVGLSSVADQKVRGYSLGMRQRLGIAASLLRSPRLLIVDEPANGLDPAGARDLWISLRSLAENGTAVLLSSHDMAVVEDVCDSITVLRAGRSVFDGTLAKMRAEAPESAYRLHTSDDQATVSHAADISGVNVERTADGLLVRADRDDLDGFVIALGRAGIAVRGLQLEATPLESLFFRLTEGSARQPRPNPGRSRRVGRQLLIGSQQ